MIPSKPIPIARGRAAGALGAVGVGGGGKEDAFLLDEDDALTLDDPAAPAAQPSPEQQRLARALALAGRAPVLSSLPGPSFLVDNRPALDLPPASPDSVSLAAILTAETTRRLVGVSSAPSHSFMAQAQRAR